MKFLSRTGIAVGLASALVVIGLAVTPAHATLISVAGPPSSLGTAPAIIPAPPHVLDDAVVNTGMQGFNEAQGVVTSFPYLMDAGVLPAGTRVNSHMIFLNHAASTLLTHTSVIWGFSNPILGVMSDSGGFFEAASTGELGAAATNYTIPFPGSGLPAPFAARGMEGGDFYFGVGTAFLTVGMIVTEPGDWIRVITLSPIPLPAAFPLYGAGIALLGFIGWKRKRSSSKTA